MKILSEDPTSGPHLRSIERSLSNPGLVHMSAHSSLECKTDPHSDVFFTPLAKTRFREKPYQIGKPLVANPSKNINGFFRSPRSVITRVLLSGSGLMNTKVNTSEPV